MAYVDDPNKKQQQNTMNILQPGAGDTQASQQGPQAPTSAPQPQTSGSSIQSAPSPRQQQKPSSGTFTNLQQYSQANQGGAQRMAQSATQQVGQQAKQIGQTAQQQAAKTQSDIAANQAKIAQEQQFARDMISRAGQEDTAESDFDRFRNIVTGQTQFNDVRDLDLSQQRVQAQQLEQQGQLTGTDAGRLDLLRQTLGKGREYSRGQSGLDSALIARDADARQGLQQGVQQSAQQAQQTLRDVGADVSSRRQALQQLNREYGAGVMTEGEQATSGVMDAVNQGLMSAQQARQQLASELGITEQQAEVQMRDLASRTSSMQSGMRTNEGFKLGNTINLAKQLSGDQRILDASGLAGYNTQGMSPQDIAAMQNALTNEDVYFYTNAWAADAKNKGNAYVWDVGGMGGMYDKLSGTLGGSSSALQKATGSEALARQLAMSGGDVSGLQGGANELYANLKAGQDINTQTAATREQAQRYNALQDLLRGRGGVGESGQRALSMDRAGQAAQQQALLEQARAEAVRKLGIK